MSLDTAKGGVVLNTRTISFLIALFTLTGILVTGVTWVNSYMFRVEALENRNKDLVQIIDNLNDKISVLNDKITDLTITLNKK